VHRDRSNPGRELRRETLEGVAQIRLPLLVHGVEPDLIGLIDPFPDESPVRRNVATACFGYQMLRMASLTP
jgi:hypothetical protein